MMPSGILGGGSQGGGSMVRTSVTSGTGLTPAVDGGHEPPMGHPHPGGGRGWAGSGVPPHGAGVATHGSGMAGPHPTPLEMLGEGGMGSYRVIQAAVPLGTRKVALQTLVSFSLGGSVQ